MTISTDTDPTAASATTGLPGFVDSHAGWTNEHRAAAADLIALDRAGKLDMVRVGFVDPHGLVRNKVLSSKVFADALRSGMDCSAFPFIADTGGDLIVDIFAPAAGVGIPEFEGSSDIIVVPDPSTFRLLPWAGPSIGWVLCDEFSKTGGALPLSPRAALKHQIARLTERDLNLVIGLEVEWHLTRLASDSHSSSDIGGFGRPGSAPIVDPVNVGYQFNSEILGDSLADILGELANTVRQLGLPLRSVEHESGPGQIEFTFEPMDALFAADSMVLLRSAVKQICTRRGYHASFMCKPAIQGFDPSGWHLHQSLTDVKTGENLFMSKSADEVLSQLARSYVGGLVKYARESSLLTTPTVNGYQRYRAEHTLSPSVAGWSNDNRGAMIRVLGKHDDSSSHIENRIGEPAANPYLYIASQIVAGLEGIDHKLDPGLMSADPHHSEGPLLATTFADAIDGLDGSELFREQLGNPLVDMLIRMKKNELKRYKNSDEMPLVNGVTEWEHREYFRFF
ncbi:hypothetical protein BJF84_15590 [Rhodococcus sp. CUA-806]|jgi:glutamine synthetase|nr:hypothetical protein BJF84_26805 [Rhodococcus sp. CUA-806]OLT31961.1 hypothetical protein BJF84_26015 [Rhodococcus sp. CUA-806]OLT34981.1 hypothetical protein BJF84_15590 [Rhodococcus sp. CUA-806]